MSTMNRHFLFSLLLALTAASHAETYQWKDNNGQTVVADTPPPATVKDRRSIGAQRPTVVSEKPAEPAADVSKPGDPPKTTAEKDLEFKKRQQEAKEKAEKQVKEKLAESDKRENCERARRNLAAMEANRPISTYDENGERKLMDANQREQEMERARRFLMDSCN